MKTILSCNFGIGVMIIIRDGCVCVWGGVIIIFLFTQGYVFDVIHIYVLTSGLVRDFALLILRLFADAFFHQFLISFNFLSNNYLNEI